MIIEATKDNLNEVYQLINELENQILDFNCFKDNYKKGLEDKNTIYMLYQLDNKIVGFISLNMHHYLHHPHPTGEVVELIVHQDYRNHKIGEQLLDYIEKKAMELGLEEIEICTSTYRKDAHRFYDHHGYVMDHYNYRKKLI